MLKGQSNHEPKELSINKSPVNDSKSFLKLGPDIKINGVSPLPLLYLGITSPVMRTPRRLTYASGPAIPICTLVLSSDGASQYG